MHDTAVIDYADTIYMTTNKLLLTQVQNAFNRGLKTAYMNHWDTIESLQRESKVGTLEKRREMHLNMASFDFSTKEVNIDVRDIRTRAHDARMVLVRRPLDPFYRKSIEFRVATNWNSLKNETRLIDTRTKFHSWCCKNNQDQLPAAP